MSSVFSYHLHEAFLDQIMSTQNNPTPNKLSSFHCVHYQIMYHHCGCLENSQTGKTIVSKSPLHIKLRLPAGWRNINSSVVFCLSLALLRLNPDKDALSIKMTLTVFLFPLYSHDYIETTCCPLIHNKYILFRLRIVKIASLLDILDSASSNVLEARTAHYLQDIFTDQLSCGALLSNKAPVWCSSPLCPLVDQGRSIISPQGVTHISCAKYIVMELQ